MKKTLMIITLITALTHSVSFAEKKEPKIFIKTGITLSENSNVAEPAKDEKSNEDPLKWKDDSKFSKQPKPAAAPAETKQDSSSAQKCYYVTSQVTNIRSTPSFMADRTGIYKYGNYVCEKSRIGEWINTGTGWVNTRFLSEKSPLEQKLAQGDVEKTDAKSAPKATTAETPKTETIPVVKQETVQPAKTVIVAQATQQETKKEGLTPAPPAAKVNEHSEIFSVPQEQAKKQLEQQTKPKTEKIKERKPEYKYISGDNVNIRVRPDSTSTIVGKYAKNEKVQILDTSSNWLRTDKGWVNIEYIAEKPANTKQKIIKCMYVSYKKANIRQSPNKHSKDLGEYDNGEEVCLYEISDGWGRSSKGWVYLHNLDDRKCYVVASKTLKVRKKPDSDSKVIMVLNKGAQACEYDRKNDWVNIGKGWVSGLYLK